MHNCTLAISRLERKYALVSPKSCEMLLVMAAEAVEDAAEGVSGGDNDDAAEGGEVICGEWGDI